MNFNSRLKPNFKNFVHIDIKEQIGIKFLEKYLVKNYFIKVNSLEDYGSPACRAVWGCSQGARKLRLVSFNSVHQAK